MGNRIRVSIGLPVFNGENYLEEAINSLLTQTISDFELIISDNASTDRTEEICQAYVNSDKRIRYYRNEQNLGPAQNFYRVFELSSAEYFKWVAHDDLNAPEFLERCIDVLDHDSGIVLCYPKTKIIDEHGNFLSNYDIEVNTNLTKPNKRLYNMLHIDHWCFQIFGVMRANILRKTLIYQGFHGFDRNILAELCLYGRVYEFPEYLFYRRDHPNASTNLFQKEPQQYQIYNPLSSRYRLLGLTRFRGYFNAVGHAQLSLTECFMCYLQLIRLMETKSVSRINRWLMRKKT